MGVGRCRQNSHDQHQVMCPSYQVTGAEEHGTRGRARLLFEMLDGHGDGPVTDGWRSTEVRDALDLCLACKGCKSDCPADVDMATYKAEFLAQHYRHRLRPRVDYAMGYLPVLARAVQATGLSGLVNRAGAMGPLRRLATRAAGLEDRTLPRFAAQSLQDWCRARPARPGLRGTVELIVDLEPSCTTVLRSDALEMMPEDQDVRWLAGQTVTLAELLNQHTSGWRPRRQPATRELAQVHCHQHAVLGWEADAELLETAGIDVERLDSGCWGLAGNFGFTAGHGKVSEALVEQVLAPRVREARPGTAILADGFSCRTQIEEFAPGHHPAHLAQLLARGL